MSFATTHCQNTTNCPTIISSCLSGYLTCIACMGYITTSLQSMKLSRTIEAMRIFNYFSHINIYLEHLGCIY